MKLLFQEFWLFDRHYFLAVGANVNQWLFGKRRIRYTGFFWRSRFISFETWIIAFRSFIEFSSWWIFFEALSFWRISIFMIFWPFLFCLFCLFWFGVYYFWWFDFNIINLDDWRRTFFNWLFLRNNLIFWETRWFENSFFFFVRHLIIILPKFFVFFSF